jgi:uncharacterized membrane protein
MTEIGGAPGAALAILLMCVATYLCRVAGVAVMSRVRLTPAVERGLRALPGCIMAAIVVPIGVASGVAAVLGISAAVAAMALRRNELLALSTGLAVVAGARALGL